MVAREAVGAFPWFGDGMPPAGPAFLRKAQRQLGENVDLLQSKLERLYEKAFSRSDFYMPVQIGPDRFESVGFIPGHRWADTDACGPRQKHKIMVIGKHPGRQEDAKGLNFIGESANLFRSLLEAAHCQGQGDWYVTNLVKFMPPEAGGSSGKNWSSWVKDCRPLLEQEIRTAQPEYILCLGADVLKALFGKTARLQACAGRVLEYHYQVVTDSGEIEPRVAKSMAIAHPAQLLYDPEPRRAMENALSRFRLLTMGQNISETEADLDHRIIDSLDDAEATLLEAERTLKRNNELVVAVDCEWQGRHPGEPGSYLRTIQISWDHKTAACFVLKEAGGNRDVIYWPHLRKLLRRFFRGKRVVGHYFNSDLAWLVHHGLDLREQFDVPRKHKGEELAWERTRHEGGADTLLMLHAIEETAEFGLESATIRYTEAPRYDLPMEEWKKSYCTEQGISQKQLDGYGEAPDDLLYPYAAYDADVSRRIFYALDALLDCDHQGNCCREAFWLSMRGTRAAFEIENTGIKMSLNRVEGMSRLFLKKREEIEKQIREHAKWPTLNLRSVYQVREYLFGEELNGKEKRLRPDDALSLYLDPVFDTSKRPMLWQDVVSKNEVELHSPSTNKLALRLIAEDNLKYSDEVNKLRDFRFIDQVLKTVLKTPADDKQSKSAKKTRHIVAPDIDELESEEWPDGGLVSFVCCDGRIKTHIRQTAETGRWASSRPPLMNLSSQRDDDLGLIIGPEYRHKLRSLLRSTPERDPGGWTDEQTIIIEADYTGAELCGAAWMANDSAMIEHTRRMQLDDDHPDFYDIHSQLAVAAFKLDCAPHKKALEKIGQAALRVCAKSVIFGALYGRSAKAVALAVREKKVRLSEKEAQKLLDTFFETYPGLASFFESCRQRVTSPGWICGAFGRFRRFPITSEREAMSNLERSAMNMPIQNLVADAMTNAVDNLLSYRDEMGDPDMFRLILQIHDAVMLEVPISRVSAAVEALRQALVLRVPVYPTDLDGMPLGTGPYRLGVEVKACEYWGEKLSEARAKELALPKIPGKLAA